MSNKASNATVTDPFEMFCFASLYYQGAAALHLTIWDHHSNSPKLMPNKTLNGLFIPSMVLLSLSLELYMKCLIVVRGNNLHGHDTRKLYEALSKDDKAAIEDRFRKHRNLVKPGTPELTFESVLARTWDCFTVVRYGYEQKTLLPFDGNVIGFVGLDDAAESVRQTILETHRDWDERYLAREQFP